MTTATASSAAYPEGPAALEPPEARGIDRDAVRLLVARPGGLSHTRFKELARILRPGDLLVVNISATLPAAVDGIRQDGRPAIVHFSTGLDDEAWVIELRQPDNSGPMLDGRSGERVRLPDGRQLRILAAYRGIEGRSRLLRASLDPPGESIRGYLVRAGRPIAYGYVEQRWPLSAYQTVFAIEPGSAEMPSAGRPFSGRLVARLIAAGIGFAPVLLHAGVSSPEAGELPSPERFRVSKSTASAVNATRRHGGRVVAVGTTVTRALESAADDEGFVSPAEGWTDLVLDPTRPARAVDGLITGWHASNATHLSLLEAVAGKDLVRSAYSAAALRGYLWHEFGDSCLLLPAGGGAQVR